MVLFALVGVALQMLAGVPDALLWSLLTGIVVAPLVPSKAACGLRPQAEREGGTP